MKITWRDPRLRPLRAGIDIVLILICLAVLYITIGCPTLSMHQEFRRAEKANLVGPSKIVDTLTTDCCGYDKMIVGETEEGICFFGKFIVLTGNTIFDKDVCYNFMYLKKSGEMTVAATPNLWSEYFPDSSRSLPVYLFTDYRNAERAEIEIRIDGICEPNYAYEDWPGYTPFDGVMQETFLGSATRDENGFFRFLFTTQDQAQIYALKVLSDTSHQVFSFHYQATVYATVQLYDSQGILIAEQTMELTA